MFSPANGKLQKLAKTLGVRRSSVYSFDLLAGHTCPAARDCFSRVIVQDDGSRKVKDGQHTEFRCYAASLEVFYPAVYDAHKRNTDIIRELRSANAIASKIEEHLPDNAKIVRIHSSGDLFNKRYFQAWILVCKRNPHILFYAYTKQLKLWVELKHLIPKNLVLTASYGGKHDELIAEHGLRSAKVVYSYEEAEELGLPVDEDDSCASDPNCGDFTLILHGVQIAGSPASKALAKLNKKKKHGGKTR